MHRAADRQQGLKAGVGSLTNPPNDIRLVGDALKSGGSDVLKPVENAQPKKIERAGLELAKGTGSSKRPS